MRTVVVVLEPHKEPKNGPGLVELFVFGIVVYLVVISKLHK